MKSLIRIIYMIFALVFTIYYFYSNKDIYMVLPLLLYILVRLDRIEEKLNNK